MAEDISARVAWALKKALTPKDAAAPSGSGTATFVRRDESGVGWVRIPGNDFDTPVAGGIVAEAQPGDTVTYNIENNGVTITGNSTSPSVGGRFVGEALAPVRKAVSGLGGRVAASLNIAEAAQAVASAINQHFWTDTHGIHVTEVTQDEWAQESDGNNILINSLGFLLRNAETWLAQFTSSAVAFYDGLGNTASNVFARFGRDGSQIGYDSESHLEMDYHSMSLVDNEGSTYFDVRDLRDAEGYVHYGSTTFTGDGTKTRFELDDADNPILPRTIDELESVTVDGVEVEYTLPYPDLTPIDTVDIAPAPARGAVVVVNVKKLRDNTYKAYTLGIRSGETGTRSYAMGTGVKASRDNVYALGRYNRGPRDGYFYYGDYLSFGNGTSDTDRSDLMSMGVVDGYDCFSWYGSFINIIRQDTSEAVFNTVRRDTGKVARFGIGAGGQNRGIWIGSLSSEFDTREDLRDDPEYYPGIPTQADGDWMIYADYYDNVHINGYGTDRQQATTSSTVSVPNATDRSIVKLTLQGSGTYILIGHAAFTSNTTGRRVVGITSEQNGSLTSGSVAPIISQPPANSVATSMTVIDVVDLPWPSAGNEEPELTRYLTVYQNSGGNLAVGGSIKAVRVSMPK